MQVVSSYGAEIKNKNIPIRHTLALYREAVRCLTEIYETVWTELSMIDQIKRRFNEAEHLVHETKKNHARFDFDARFPEIAPFFHCSNLVWYEETLPSACWIAALLRYDGIFGKRASKSNLA